MLRNLLEILDEHTPMPLKEMAVKGTIIDRAVNTLPRPYQKHGSAIGILLGVAFDAGYKKNSWVEILESSYTDAVAHAFTRHSHHHLPELKHATSLVIQKVKQFVEEENQNAYGSGKLQGYAFLGALGAAGLAVWLSSDDDPSQ